jgi:serine/threonine protein kinase
VRVRVGRETTARAREKDVSKKLRFFSLPLFPHARKSSFSKMAKRQDTAVSPTPAAAKLTKVGPYIVGKTLGSGCTGEVKLAYHKDTGFQVAIKIIRYSSRSVLLSLIPVLSTAKRC